MDKKQLMEWHRLIGLVLTGLAMSYTMDDFRRDYILNHLDELSADEVLKRYSADEILKNRSSDEVLKHYSPQDRLKGLTIEERLKGLSNEEIVKKVLAKLSPAEISRYLNQKPKH